MRDAKLRRLAKSLGAEYVYFNRLSGMVGFFNNQVWRFRVKALKRFLNALSLRRQIARIYRTSTSSDEAISKVYDVEYGGSGGSNYMYLNALLVPNGFEKITGLSKSALTNLQIIDIGAGSNELLRYIHKNLDVSKSQLFGVDVSTASKDIIVKDGFHGYVGKIEDQHFAENSFDMTFLTYFIDYDTAQQSTFEESVRITKPSGRIVLEGRLPCRPFGLSSKDEVELKFITKGQSVEEDITLVHRAFQESGERQQKKVRLEKIVRGSRYVYSHYGLHELDSYFLVFSIQ